MKKRAFSGIQPSGIPTLGNYFGALRNWVLMQDDYDCVMSVVNLHAITQRFDPEVLKQRTEYVFSLLLALGLDPEKTVLFVQSHVPQHSELSWILNCYTMFGEMSRMTQFKEKSVKRPENVNVGLFDYPVLMAADILLYDSDVVPVGLDQKQHVEIARDIADRFNGIYGDIFVTPEPVIPTIGGKIMSLLEPTRKMDKSDPNPGAFISLADDRDTIIKKFKRAVTDSDAQVVYDPETKPGVSNLMGIYSLCTNKDIAAVQAEFESQGYGAFKTAVGESVADTLGPIQKQVLVYQNDPAQLSRMMKIGADRAKEIAGNTMNRVWEAVGILHAE
jgi:tryptophanyl-tRNA synthetase